MRAFPPDPHRPVAVLHGGPSSEHDISIVSSRGVVGALRDGGHRVVPVFIDLHGRWHFGDEASPAGQESVGLALPEACAALTALAPSVCFLGFHGTFGEDGRVQALLDLLGQRYTGSGPLASALAMDKVMARRVFAASGLRIAGAREWPASALTDDAACAAAAEATIAAVGLPCVAKVAAGGSSVGVEIAQDRQGVCDALRRLRRMWPVVLVEQFVRGTELTCGVLDGDGGSVALPCVEIAPVPGRFFDREVKYDARLVEEIVPARVAPEVEQRLRQAALAAHRALGCRGVSRTDAIATGDGEVWLLETNTLPGLTPTSLLPKAAAAAGVDYLALLERILAAAVAPADDAAPARR